MESITVIVVPKNNKIELIVPDNFIGKKVEIFAFELGDAYGGSKAGPAGISLFRM